jgi:hypothetical protein
MPSTSDAERIVALEAEVAHLHKLLQSGDKDGVTTLPRVDPILSQADAFTHSPVASPDVHKPAAQDKKQEGDAEKASVEKLDDYLRPTFQLLDTHLQHTATPFSAFAGTFFALGGLSLAQTLVPATDPEHLVVFAASFGALSTLLFGAPAAPLGKPRNAFYGHLIAVATALAVHYADVAARDIIDIPPSLERVLTPSLSIALMVLFKTPHPPAAAIVTFYATLPEGLRGGMFLLFPAVFGCIYFYGIQMITAFATKALAERSNSDWCERPVLMI